MEQPASPLAVETPALPSAPPREKEKTGFLLTQEGQTQCGPPFG